MQETGNSLLQRLDLRTNFAANSQAAAPAQLGVWGAKGGVDRVSEDPGNPSVRARSPTWIRELFRLASSIGSVGFGSWDHLFSWAFPFFALRRIAYRHSVPAQATHISTSQIILSKKNLFLHKSCGSRAVDHRGKSRLEPRDFWIFSLLATVLRCSFPLRLADKTEEKTLLAALFKPTSGVRFQQGARDVGRQQVEIVQLQIRRTGARPVTELSRARKSVVNS
jgi:hypothetical protein